MVVLFEVLNNKFYIIQTRCICMNVTGGFIDWNGGYDQRPTLHVIISGEIPQLEDFTFKSDNNKSFWWAEYDGFFTFFAGHPDRPRKGFGGDSYTLNVENGDTVTLKGPFSSRSGIVNAYGHGPCVSVKIHENNSKDRYRTISISLSHAQEAAEYAGVELFKDNKRNRDGQSTEYTYEVENTYPTEWEWEGEENPDRIMPYGEGTFTHSNGCMIDVSSEEIKKERRTFGKTESIDVTVYKSTMYDQDGEMIEQTITQRPDIGYLYLMDKNADKESMGRVKNAKKQTEKYEGEINN